MYMYIYIGTLVIVDPSRKIKIETNSGENNSIYLTFTVPYSHL